MPRLAVAVLGLLAALVPAAAARADYVIDGRGFGHGVGMSQYGAYGYALREGRDFRWILGHYYPGTNVGRVATARMRVLLRDTRVPKVCGATAMRDAAGRRVRLRDDRVYAFTALGADKLRVTDTRTRRTRARLRAPVRVTGGASVCVRGTAINGVRDGSYRGALRLHRDDGRTILAVNELGLESYLQGVVAAEMPSTWSAEALKAQAVVARSYALRSLRPDRVFDVYADVRSQAYRGVAGEAATAVAAARATRGLAVRYGVEIAQTFFHSTSGGRTSGYVEGFGGGLPVPYLQPVDDPYDDISPVHTWTVRLTDAEMAKALRDVRLGDLQDVKVTATGETGRVSTADVVGEEGTATVSGLELRRLLELRSHWFAIRREPGRPTHALKRVRTRLDGSTIVRYLGRTHVRRQCHRDPAQRPRQGAGRRRVRAERYRHDVRPPARQLADGAHHMTPSAQNAGGGRRVTRWTRELIISKIREWNDRYGEPPCSADWNPSLARWRAQEWRAERYREGVWPSTNAAKRPFEGSFDAAVRAAGLEPHKPGPRRRLPGEARPAVERRDDGWARVPRDVADELLAADERARLAEAHAAALERRLAAAERRAERAEDKVGDARRRARRASEQAGRARRARERTRLTAAETRELTHERLETLATDAEARVRASEDQAEAAAQDAYEARRAMRAADARASGAEARAVAAERLAAAARAELTSEGTSQAWAATRAAEARAAEAERRSRELASLVCGEQRRLSAGELAALREGGPSGPAVLAAALKALGSARASRDRTGLAAALGELASAAVRWRDRL